jgi:hypothetical protein
MPERTWKQKVEQMPFFFIIGRSRSGTTLLMTLFDAHPHVIMPFESPFILVLSRRYAHLHYWNKDDLLRFFNDLQSISWKFDSWGMDREKLKADLLSLEGEVDFATVCKVVHYNFQSVFPKEKIQVIGDKNPKYSLKLKEIHQLFPDAKYIHIIRDYRDHLYSMLKVNFLDSIIPQIIYQWAYAARLAQKYSKKYPENFYNLRYEDLASKPEESFGKLCDFLGITYTEDVFKFQEKKDEISKQVNNEAFESGHTSLFNPIDTRRTNTWQDKLSSKEIKIAEWIAHPIARKYGYNKSTKRLGILNLFYLLPRLYFIRLFYFYQYLINRLPTSMRKKLRSRKSELAKKYYRVFKKDFLSYKRFFQK